jgi:hypothetical protein
MVWWVVKRPASRCSPKENGLFVLPYLGPPRTICSNFFFFYNFFHINFAKIYGPQKKLQNYTSGAVGDGGGAVLQHLPTAVGHGGGV